jgi:hypothetical protein
MFRAERADLRTLWLVTAKPSRLAKRIETGDRSLLLETIPQDIIEAFSFVDKASRTYGGAFARSVCLNVWTMLPQENVEWCLENVAYDAATRLAVLDTCRAMSCGLVELHSERVDAVLDLAQVRRVSDFPYPTSLELQMLVSYRDGMLLGGDFGMRFTSQQMSRVLGIVKTLLNDKAYEYRAGAAWSWLHESLVEADLGSDANWCELVAHGILHPLAGDTVGSPREEVAQAISDAAHLSNKEQVVELVRKGVEMPLVVLDVAFSTV